MHYQIIENNRPTGKVITNVSSSLSASIFFPRPDRQKNRDITTTFIEYNGEINTDKVGEIVNINPKQNA